MLEAVGNNLANLNTTAFKSSRVLFSDMMYQTPRNATSSSNLLSSMNAIQIGTGSTVSQVDLNLQQGNLETTERPLDLAIHGGGFFVGVAGNKTTYARAGTFKIDQEGFLSDPSTGNLIQRFGTAGEQNSVGPSFQTSGDNRVYLPKGAVIPGSATQVLTATGNLPGSLTGPVSQALITSSPFRVGGVAANMATNLNDLDANIVNYQAGETIRFSGYRHDGSVPVPADFSVTPTTTVGDLIAALNAAFSGATVTMTLDGNLVATADNATSLRIGADGYAAGELNDFQVDSDGKLYGTATNGIQVLMAQLAIASFRNPDGLLSLGSNYFQRSLASGDPEFGTALNGSRGEIRSGQLEGSNVNLALEFTRLIIAQRGFSANARTITVTDQILQELTNLIR